MKDDIGQIISFLRREYLFRGLKDDELAEIASRFSRVEFARDHVVFQQGQPADSFFLVLDGSVRLIRRGSQGERLLNVLGPGDFFGEQALLLGHLSSASVTTAEPSTLLGMDKAQFTAMLADFPGIRHNLIATARSRAQARRINLEWLDTDEVIYLLVRKHEFFLFISMILPVVLTIGSIPLLTYAIVDATLMGNLALAAGTLMVLGGFAWGVWSWLDWGNDYFIVTSQRVVWLEKVIGLYESRREAPLDAILAVNTVSSQLGRILDYGNVSIKTFTGSIYMEKVNHPSLFAAFIEGYKRRVLDVTREKEEKSMGKDVEQALRQRFNLPAMPSAKASQIIQPAAFTPIITQSRRRSHSGGLGNFLNRILKVRYEKDGVITYRKHWLLLIQKAWQPVLVGLFLAVCWGYLAWLQLFGEISGATFFYLLIFLLGTSLFNFLWLGYHFWDWSNDIYRLTSEQILDIERKPLGQEIKKTANLDAILSIEHERENLLGILFNFGPVTINVGQTKFIFIGVHNPDQVHQDVADYREAVLRRKRTAEITRERKRMIDWLVSYHEATSKMDTQQKDIDWDTI